MNSYEEGEELSAGSLTTRILGSNAFDQSVPGLPINEDLLKSEMRKPKLIKCSKNIPFLSYIHPVTQDNTA